LEKEIQFKIKFITPLLLHGADPRQVDALGLAKALRGEWRFWFRAIAGGILYDYASPVGELSKGVYEQECRVFGSADDKVGAKFRMLVEPVSVSQPKKPFLMRFSRTVPFQGFDPGATFNVTVQPRVRVGFERNALLSSIWLWANLGAIGQRARRGFGSPVILEESKDVFKEASFEVKESFESREALEEHLKASIEKCWAIIDSMEKRGVPMANDAPKNAPFFILKSLKQVAVGDSSEASVQDLLQRMHGSDSCQDLGWANLKWLEGYARKYQITFSSPQRMASPICLRVCNVGEGLTPLAVWCKQQVSLKIMKGGQEQNSLEGTIPSSVCLRSYLTGAPWPGGISFPGLSFHNTISGDSI